MIEPQVKPGNVLEFRDFKFSAVAGQGWEGGRGGRGSGPSRSLPPKCATLSPSPSGTPVTALLSRAGRPAGRAGHSGVPQPEPAGYGLRRRPRPPHRAAEARQPVPGITTESKP
jgi:hypothetical protein